MYIYGEVIYLEFIAHIRELDGKKQSVFEHCSSVSSLAKDYAKDEFKSIVSLTGLYHDIGKYAVTFQKRLYGSNVRFEHSICGALELEKVKSKNDIMIIMMQYCIAGHHTGLPDGGSNTDVLDCPTLQGRLKKVANYSGENSYNKYSDEITIKVPDFTPLIKYILSECKTKEDALEEYAFFTRYVFSCLKDADFIDTEVFCKPEIERGVKGDFKKALEILNKRLSEFKQDTIVRKSRTTLMKQAISNSGNGNIHILNMPTGSGKTLCSLKLALEKAVKEGKKRIVYVIPYTSIIEQTANDFEDMFKEVLPVLQHHSNYNYDETEDNSDKTNDKMKLSCENWDAPLIVTTSIQFFQSLYHYKGSGLRKLHNLADSVIIFDEIHLIPTEYIQPCLRGVGYISRHLNSECIFLSATMPNYDKLFKKYISDSTTNELIRDKESFVNFQNCEYINLSKTDYENIIQKADQFQSSLIIVNKRQTARDVFNKVEGKKYHLSTYMSPYHRSGIISSIKRDLKDNIKITVVSTSLVEAGVDLDFESVFRELTGLDSILQAGGRCNREGKRKTGKVFIFETDDRIRNGDIQTRINITKNLLDTYPTVNSSECIEEYYNRLFNENESDIHRNTIAHFDSITNSFDSRTVNTPMTMPFKSYAQNFKYINSDTISIVINHENDNCQTLISKLILGNMQVRRSLQRYSVSVYRYEFDDILKLGILGNMGNGIYLLSNMNYYDEMTGLNPCLVKDEDYIF